MPLPKHMEVTPNLHRDESQGDHKNESSWPPHKVAYKAQNTSLRYPEYTQAYFFKQEFPVSKLDLKPHFSRFCCHNEWICPGVPTKSNLAGTTHPTFV